MARYLYVNVPGCPVAPASGGSFPLHRLVLYAKLGPGPHPCFRCERPVDWTDSVTAEGALVVNHLDNDSRNNAWDNLVPSCHSCNLAHARDVEFADGPFLVIEGKRHRATERTCIGCGGAFLVRTSGLRSAERKGKRYGLYCSQTCLWARDRSQDGRR